MAARVECQIVKRIEANSRQQKLGVKEYRTPILNCDGSVFWLCGARLVLDIAYGPSVGKGTGERTLMMQIIKRVKASNLLFMVDAGLYSFLMMWTIDQQNNYFLLKVSSHPVLPVEKQWPDGRYRSTMSGKILDSKGSTAKTKKVEDRKPDGSCHPLPNTWISSLSFSHQSVGHQNQC